MAYALSSFETISSYSIVMAYIVMAYVVIVVAYTLSSFETISSYSLPCSSLTVTFQFRTGSLPSFRRMPIDSLNGSLYFSPTTDILTTH